MIQWAERLDAEGLIALATYRGKNGITTLLPRLRGEGVGLATIYCEPRTAYIQLWPTVFNRRAPSAIPLVETELGAPIKQGQRIQTVSDALLAAVASAYHEANGRAVSSS